MTRWMTIAAFAVSASSLLAQAAAPRPKFDAFEVATVKPVDFSIYELQVAKSGPKLKPSASRPDEPAVVSPGVVYPPDRVVLPGRNATMTNFVSLLQRATLNLRWWLIKWNGLRPTDS
jgi:hypothetical protein